MSIATRPLTPWFKGKRFSRPPSTVVLHATAGSSLIGAVETLRARNLGYRYLIEKSGWITKGAPLTRQLSHCGTSFGPEGKSVNRYSIGIAFVNRNDGVDPYTYTFEQITACQLLLQELALGVQSLRWLTTHRDIAPTRKTDPAGLGLGNFFVPTLQVWPSE